MITTPDATSSRQIAWFEVFQFVDRLLTTSVGSRPTAGTPDWQNLDDTDPRKLDAVLVFGVYQALRIDAEQAELADASRAIGAAVDCTALAQRVRAGRGDAYIPRRAAS